jgi:hypothetical protein
LVKLAGGFAVFTGERLKLQSNFPNLTAAVSGTLTNPGRFR